MRWHCTVMPLVQSCPRSYMFIISYNLYLLDCPRNIENSFDISNIPKAGLPSLRYLTVVSRSSGSVGHLRYVPNVSEGGKSSSISFSSSSSCSSSSAASSSSSVLVVFFVVVGVFLLWCWCSCGFYWWYCCGNIFIVKVFCDGSVHFSGYLFSIY